MEKILSFAARDILEFIALRLGKVPLQTGGLHRSSRLCLFL